MFEKKGQKWRLTACVCFSLCCFRLFPPCFLFSLHSLFFFFSLSFYLFLYKRSFFTFFLHIVVAYTHTHTCQRTCTGSKSWDCLFVCFFFNDTLAHPYISSTYFPFLLFFCVRCHWSQGTSFFFVVVVRSVALSLLSLTSVLHFFASEVFLFFSFFFFARRHSHTRIKTEY